MNKHVEQDHVVLFKRYIEEIHVHPQNLLIKNKLLNGKMLPQLPFPNVPSSNPSKNPKM
jgi:hypothetical protein